MHCPRRLALTLLWLLCAGAALAADTVRPVESWDDYRAGLIDAGSSAAEAGARISELLASLNGMDRSAGDDLIGLPAPPFRFEGWLNSDPLELEDLRGKVVLVRWWTDTCPLCASSAPGLRALHADYADQGMVLIGVFHPKAGRDDPLDTRRIDRAVASRGFAFPIAIDWNWREGTLKDWWLTGPDRPATSVTFLLDKQGVIRFIHPRADVEPGHRAGSTQVALVD